VALRAVQHDVKHGTGLKLGGLTGGVPFSSAARFYRTTALSVTPRRFI
jgi:hypothetical protein